MEAGWRTHAVSFVKVFLVILALIILVWFIVPNVEETAQIRLIWPLDHTYPMPLAIALMLAFVIGMLTQYVISLFREIRSRTQVHRLKRENQRLVDELEKMRRAPIEDIGGTLDEPLVPRNTSPSEL
jgi:uncharacterized integral membrane protein